ncbi:MAG TPA: tetratricopeptide repeat protein [Candidatus Polarisedimenticolia bacterium]|nr:tetratricopeptide repeat protein [Candidatus Polarisedimenticolia bacterium]
MSRIAGSGKLGMGQSLLAGAMLLASFSSPFAQEAPAAPPTQPPAAVPAAPEPESPTTTAPKPPARKPDSAVPLDIDVLSEKVARHPDNPYLLNELGNLFLKQGRRKDAEARYARAVKLDKNFAAAWNNLGVVRYALGHKSEAKIAYRKAVAIQPNYALAWYNLGVVLDAENFYTEAIHAYERAFALDPGLLDVRQNPQIVSNNRVPAVMAQTYIDRGGTVVFPIESSYPQ